MGPGNEHQQDKSEKRMANIKRTKAPVKPLRIFAKVNRAAESQW